MRNKPIVSIIIATHNSARLLPKVLQSIKSQDYPRSKIEVLVIDGGSTDDTRHIARMHGSQVIDNPKILPAWAKYIGFLRARGTYLMYLDSDEVIDDTRSITRKVKAFEIHPSVRAVTGSGYKSPKSFSFLNDYINEFGDPFSFFIYRLSKDYRFFIHSMKTRYKILAENKDGIAFDFSQVRDLPIFELVAMGSMVDHMYLKKNFPTIKTHPGLIPHFFHLLVSKGASIAITKHDVLIHYSSNTLRQYVGKIVSRVVSNIFTPAKEGFRGRNEFASGVWQYKKYFFPLYAVSIVFPFIDALYLSVTRKNIGYMIHVPLCLYTAALIVYYAGLKLLGVKPVLKSYGQATTLRS